MDQNVKKRRRDPFTVCTHLDFLLDLSGIGPRSLHCAAQCAVGLSDKEIYCFTCVGSRRNLLSSRSLYICTSCCWICCERHLGQHFMPLKRSRRVPNKGRKSHAIYLNYTHRELWCCECRDYVYHPLTDAAIKFARKKWEDSSIPLPEEPHSDPTGYQGLRGIYNLGNTCATSVVLQALIHNATLRNFFLGASHNPRKCTTEFCVACELQKTMHIFWTSSGSEPFIPDTMIKSTWNSVENSNIQGFNQQDASEVFTGLLTSLHKSMGGIDDNCNCSICSTFMGQLSSTTSCQDCSLTRIRFDPFSMINLIIQKNSSCDSTRPVEPLYVSSLEESLELYTSSETVWGYKCPKCDKISTSTKILRIVKAPPCAIFVLKRFRHGNQRRGAEKIVAWIQFPLELDLSPYFEEHSVRVKSSKLFKLKVVIVHNGALEGGHYISFIEQNGDWFRHDDQIVSKVSCEEVLSENAYILCYVATA